MRMLHVLLSKDLRRAWRNPLPFLIHLLVPLCITALVGMVFGGRSESGGLGRIAFAIVDEDDSMLTQFLRGAANQGQGGKYLAPEFLDREAALRRIQENKLAAALIIPTNFTHHYLTGAEAVSLELVKNPAQSIHPAVLEELLGALVTGLNAVSRNLQSEFPDWHEVADGHGDFHRVAGLVERMGEKLQVAKKYIRPPLVIYRHGNPEQESDAAAEQAGDPAAERGGDAPRVEPSRPAKTQRPGAGIFSYLLIGMAAMFLLFQANTAMTDLHREMRLHTLTRFQTIRHRFAPFLVGKVVFAAVMLLLCAGILLGGGGLIFRIEWQQPGPMLALTLGYAVFAAGMAAALVALMPDERRAGALTTVTSMGLALVSGCMFPPQALPAFLREHVAPRLPCYWFADTMRNLQFSSDKVEWGAACVKLIVVAVVLLAWSSWLMQRAVRKGARA